MKNEDTVIHTRSACFLASIHQSDNITLHVKFSEAVKSSVGSIYVVHTLLNVCWETLAKSPLFDMKRVSAKGKTLLSFPENT